jgi:phosphoglycerate kinase
MKTIDAYNFSGKRVLIRVDFNVPLDKASLAVTDDTRIRAAIPTLRKILNEGGTLVLMSHLGRPKDGPVDKYSLKHTLATLSKLCGVEVKFANDCIGEQAQQLAKNLKAGEVLLLENLRFYKEEEKGDEAFAQKLASLGDFYVNDAFGTAHRAHASTAVIAKFFPTAKCFGYVMANEIANADKVMKNAERPFTAVMGGAKVSDKILILEQLMKKVDHLIIGGGMTYTFVKALGGNIGASLCEEDKVELAKEIIERAKTSGVKLHLPMDSVTADAFSNEAKIAIANSNEITAGWMGLDIGPKAVLAYAEVLKNSKTILWNGPMGVFEMSQFENGTKKVAEAIAEATQKGAFSLIGGGDSAAAVAKFNMVEQVSYVSTGGGALLEYFEGKSLPGIDAILN